MNKLFQYLNSRISYRRFGHGERVMVAFHGYGQSSADFLFFEPVWNEDYTVIAIDFFFHGESVWLEDRDFTREDMRNIVIGIAGLESLTPEKFSVCSFSMGARMARALIQTFPTHIDRYFMLSPPTFAFNYFLQFAVNTPVGLKLFRYFIRKNNSLLALVKLLRSMGILNRSVYVFSSKFMINRERLERVYRTWYAQRNLTTDFKQFAHLLNAHDIEVVLIAGQHDAITPAEQLAGYVRRLRHGQVFLIEQKHRLQTPECMEVFRAFGRMIRQP